MSAGLWFAATVYLGLTRCEDQTTKATPLNLGWALWSEKGAVLLAWTEDGKTRQFLLPSSDPATLVAASRSGRCRAILAGLPGSRYTRVRHDPGPGARSAVSESSTRGGRGIPERT
jgi:hypothetical protein